MGRGARLRPGSALPRDSAADRGGPNAAQRARSAGYAIANVDCTIVCETPKIGPHAERMRASLAETAGVETGRVSVKATTSERLGFTGRGEGIAALATVALVKP